MYPASSTRFCRGIHAIQSAKPITYGFYTLQTTPVPFSLSDVGDSGDEARRRFVGWVGQILESVELNRRRDAGRQKRRPGEGVQRFGASPDDSQLPATADEVAANEQTPCVIVGSREEAKQVRDDSLVVRPAGSRDFDSALSERPITAVDLDQADRPLPRSPREVPRRHARANRRGGLVTTKKFPSRRLPNGVLSSGGSKFDFASRTISSQFYHQELRGHLDSASVFDWQWMIDSPRSVSRFGGLKLDAARRVTVSVKTVLNQRRSPESPVARSG